MSVSKSDYIVIGDTEKYKDCLVYVCGTKEHAEKVLERMLNDPTETDLLHMQGHSNFRIEEVPKEDCWWRGYLD